MKWRCPEAVSTHSAVGDSCCNWQADGSGAGSMVSAASQWAGGRVEGAVGTLDRPPRMMDLAKPVETRHAASACACHRPCSPVDEVEPASTLGTSRIFVPVHRAAEALIRLAPE